MKKEMFKKIFTGMLVMLMILTCIPANDFNVKVEAAESDTYDLAEMKSYKLVETYNEGSYIVPKKEGKYPVLFMVHGSGGPSCETAFVNEMNRWIKLGYVDPMVIVMPHIKQIKEPKWGITDFGEFTSNGYLKNLVDYIKAGSLTSKAKTDIPFSITGYSMGGSVSLHAGVTLPDVFHNVGAASPSWCFYNGTEGWVKKASDIAFKDAEDSHFMIGYGDGEGEWRINDAGEKYWYNQFQDNVERDEKVIKENGLNKNITFKKYVVSKDFGGHGWNIFKRQMFYFLYYVKNECTPADKTIEVAMGVSKDALYGNVSISGTCKAGNEVSVNVSNSNATEFNYKWRVGKNYIDGANTKTYKLTNNEAGKKISCEVSDKSGKYVGIISGTSESVVEKLVVAPPNDNPSENTDGNTDAAPSNNSSVDKAVEVKYDNKKDDKKTDVEENNTNKENDKKLKKGLIVYSKSSKYIITKVTYKNDKLVGGTVKFLNPISKKNKSFVIADTLIINGAKFNVTAINKNAFKKCKNLKKVTIGNNVTSIGAKAFAGCKKLKNIKIKSKKIKKVGKSAFKGINKKAVITAPKKLKKKYKKLLLKKGVKKTVKFRN